ncbi:MULTISPECIES: hypothetical protein [unclassified Streptomyces]|uniref:hypothetical protein n=1 Tax=unclassified Streptomyces TaxID=2593676 RepID=UPI003826B00D
MTLRGCATYGQLLLCVSLLAGILHLLRNVAVRVTPLPLPGPRQDDVRTAPLSVLRI